jgi:hypothetical protein
MMGMSFSPGLSAGPTLGMESFTSPKSLSTGPSVFSKGDNLNDFSGLDPGLNLQEAKMNFYHSIAKFLGKK